MRVLSETEMTDVSGGAIPLLVVLGFVYSHQDEIRGFFDAAYEAYGNTRLAHQP
jgi:hypothetical protein